MRKAIAARPAKAPTAIAAGLGQAAERVSLPGANIPRTPGGGGKSKSSGPTIRLKGHVKQATITQSISSSVEPRSHR